jgi:hypothetical protein
MFINKRMKLSLRVRAAMCLQRMRQCLPQQVPTLCTALHPTKLKTLCVCLLAALFDVAADDAAVLAAAGAHIVHGPAPNPFKSLAPLLDSAVGPDRFYYMNAVLSCFKGRAGGSGKGCSSVAGKAA